MNGVSAVQSASLGIQQNTAEMASAAERIARTPAADPEADSKRIEDAIRMKLAKLGIEVNVTVIKTSSQATGQIIDMLV
ncbi:MAG: hypothetical protein R3C28_19340 [Pirellulaceae bacterium]